MNELQRLTAQAVRFENEVDHLMIQLEGIEQPHYLQLQLATSQAKRVRRECNILIKSLAIMRDNLQPTEAQGNVGN